MTPASHSTRITIGLGALAALGMASEPPRTFYRLESALQIESPTPPNWDYLTFDPSHNYLYIARREDGILIYDAQAKKIVGSIANTKGGNATTLTPEFDRGYVTNADGSLTIFELRTLKTLERIKVGNDADNAFYDPITKQLMVTQGDSKQVTFLDAATGAISGRLSIDSERIEGSEVQHMARVNVVGRAEELFDLGDAEAFRPFRRRRFRHWPLGRTRTLPGGIEPLRLDDPILTPGMGGPGHLSAEEGLKPLHQARVARCGLDLSSPCLRDRHLQGW